METASVGLHDDLRKRAFLLNQVAAAAAGTLTQAAANRAIPAAVKRGLGLTPPQANDVRLALVTEGHLKSDKKGRTITFALTDSGSAYLESIRAHLPEGAAPRGRYNPPPNDAVRQGRVEYLLLQVLKARGQALRKSDANRFDLYGKESLELNSATATRLRHDLAREGLLAVAGAGRGESYALTPAGALRLGNASFPARHTFTLKGEALNALLEAAREVAKQFAAVPAAGGKEPQVSADRLEAAVLDAVAELRRERHSVSGLVPVHEVRAAVKERLGPQAGRHDAFDEAAHRLRRAGRLRLVPIADPGRAPAEHLQDSIPGVGETLFYFEVAHEPAPV